MSLDILTSSWFLSTGTFSMVFRVISWHRRPLRSDDKQIKGLCGNRSLNSLLICWSVNSGCSLTILAAASQISLSTFTLLGSTSRWEHQFSLLCSILVPADNRPSRSALYLKGGCNLHIILVFQVGLYELLFIFLWDFSSGHDSVM